MKTNFPGETLFAKAKSAMQTARRSVVYPLFLLQAVLRTDTTPVAHKVFIVSALAYFFLRTDVIPDFLPVIGYTDDIAVLLGAISTVSRNVTPEVEAEAKADFDLYFTDRPSSAV